MPDVSTIRVILPRTQVVRVSSSTPGPVVVAITGFRGIGTGGGGGNTFSLNGSTNSVSLVAGNNITLQSNASTITISGPTVPTATNFSLNATSSSVSLSAGANIGIGQANSTITLSASNQTSSLSYISSLNGSSGALSISAGAGIGIGQANSTITVSASNQTSSLAYVAALGTAAATSTGTILLAAGNNITLNTGVSSITIVGPTVPAATNFVLNATSSSVSISAGAGIGIGQANSTITISASVQAEGTQSFSGGGTSITGTGVSVALVGGNNISLASASGAGSLTLTFNASSNALANVSLLNASSGAMSVSAGAGIGIGQANSTITISASNQTSTLSYVAALGTAAATSTGTIVLAAGNNITLNTGANSITIVGVTPVNFSTISGNIAGNTAGSSTFTVGNTFQISLTGGLSGTASGSSITLSAATAAAAAGTISYTAGVELNRVVGTILSRSGTVTGTTGFGSSFFLSRIRIPAVMSLSEIDIGMSIGFPATSQGAGTMSRSFVIYSFGNSTSLASVASVSGTSSWNTGTSTAGASASLTQFQGGWASQLIQPMTFASTSISAGEYVVGQIFDFAQVSSTWTVNFYGAPVPNFAVVAGSFFTNSSSLAFTGWAGAIGTIGIGGVGTTASFVTNTASLISATATVASTVSVVFSNANIAAFAALRTIGLSAISGISSYISLPNFGYVGTGSTTSGAGLAFVNGVMSTGAVPTTLAITNAALTYTGNVAFSQPWFALVGA